MDSILKHGLDQQSLFDNDPETDPLISHTNIRDPTLADAILDRIVHSAHRLELKGDSMRKKQKPLTQLDDSDN